MEIFSQISPLSRLKFCWSHQNRSPDRYILKVNWPKYTTDVVERITNLNLYHIIETVSTRSSKQSPNIIPHEHHEACTKYRFPETKMFIKELDEIGDVDITTELLDSLNLAGCQRWCKTFENLNFTLHLKNRETAKYLGWLFPHNMNHQSQQMPKPSSSPKLALKRKLNVKLGQNKN